MQGHTHNPSPTLFNKYFGVRASIFDQNTPHSGTSYKDPGFSDIRGAIPGLHHTSSFIIWGSGRGGGRGGREYFFKQYSLSSEKLCQYIFCQWNERRISQRYFSSRGCSLQIRGHPGSISSAILSVCSNFLVWAELAGSSPEKARRIRHLLLCEKPALNSVA